MRFSQNNLIRKLKFDSYLQFFQTETPAGADAGVVAESWAPDNRSQRVSRPGENTTSFENTLVVPPLLASRLVHGK